MGYYKNKTDEELASLRDRLEKSINGKKPKKLTVEHEDKKEEDRRHLEMVKEEQAKRAT